MRYRYEKLNFKGGFTLIETVVGVVTLSILFGGFVLFFQSISNVVGKSKIRAEAIALANARTEEIRNLTYDDVGTVGGIPSGPLLQEEAIEVNGFEYIVKTTVVYIDDPFDGLAPDDVIPNDYKRASVSVTWEGVFASNSPVYMVTDSAPEGLEMAAGGGTLVIEVINALGEAVPGATVSIYSDQVLPAVDLEILTDSKGRVVLPATPECTTECYEISVSKPGYSTDRTYSTVEVTNPYKPHVNMIAGRVIEPVFKIDLLGSINFYVVGARDNGYPAFQGVQFSLRSNKGIGTDDQGDEVSKYEEDHVSGLGGYVQVPNLEWAAYTIEFAAASSVDLAGSVPFIPIVLEPGSNLTSKIVVEPASGNSLLAIATDLNDNPIATASMTLLGPGSFVATESGGVSSAGDVGQALFSNLVSGNYELYISQVGYKTSSGSAIVDGNKTQKLVLENE